MKQDPLATLRPFMLTAWVLWLLVAAFMWVFYRRSSHRLQTQGGELLLPPIQIVVSRYQRWSGWLPIVGLMLLSVIGFVQIVFGSPMADVIQTIVLGTVLFTFAGLPPNRNSYLECRTNGLIVWWSLATWQSIQRYDWVDGHPARLRVYTGKYSKLEIPLDDKFRAQLDAILAERLPTASVLAPVA